MSANEIAEAILLVIKRLAKWAALGLLSIGAIGAFAFWGHEKWQNRPQVVSSLMEIAIGEKWADVVFRQGEFVVEKTNWVKKYQDAVEYFNNEKRVSFSVRNGVVTSVNYSCNSNVDYTKLNGVECGASGDKILKRFEDKVRVLCSKNADEGNMFLRVYDVVEFGTRYFLVVNKVGGVSHC